METPTPQINIPEEKIQSFCRQAQRDAGNDSAASNHDSWRHSLKNIAKAVAEQMGMCFDAFKKICEEAAKKASAAQLEIDARLVPGYVDTVVVEANRRMAEASPILGQVGKSASLMGEYNKRFPNVAGGNPPEHKANNALSFGLVIFLIAAESFANSRLFAEADDYGLLGGALLAVLVSCINVIPVLFLGIGVTKARGHIGAPSWLWGTICAFAFLYAIGVNIVIWVLRNNRIIEAGGIVDQTHSIALFIIGMVIAGIAFYKGWKIPDLYAKFRECQLRLEKDKARYTNVILGPVSSERERAASAEVAFIWEVDQLKKAVSNWHANSPLIAHDGRIKVGQIWQQYHSVYAPLYNGHPPILPDINDSAIAEDMDIRIHGAWDAFAESQRQKADEQAGVADGKLPEFRAVRDKLIGVEQRFVAVITAKINDATI